MPNKQKLIKALRQALVIFLLNWDWGKRDITAIKAAKAALDEVYNTLVPEA